MKLKDIDKSQRIKISPGNRKMGMTPSVSLPPITTCIDNAPCAKGCYVIRNMSFRPAIINSYKHNLNIYNKDPDLYFQQIRLFCNSKNVKYFRFHVGGDIPDQDYLNRVIRMCRYQCKDTKFVMFTKKYDLDFKGASKNLSIVLSAWPGLTLPKKRMPIGFMQNNKETRVKNAITCPNSCEQCRCCWDLKILKKNVVFNYH